MGGSTFSSNEYKNVSWSLLSDKVQLDTFFWYSSKDSWIFICSGFIAIFLLLVAVDEFDLAKNFKIGFSSHVDDELDLEMYEFETEGLRVGSTFFDLELFIEDESKVVDGGDEG